MITRPLEREILFGLLAQQHRLIDESSLQAAVIAWRADPSKHLAEHLLHRGSLDPEGRRTVDDLVSRHLERHGGDPAGALAALRVPAWFEEGRSATRDPASHAETLAEAVGAGEPGLAAAGAAEQRFRVLKPHARGGLGAVYLALDRELNREVALKQILDARADDPTSRRRFVLEAEITGRLEHPGIVPVYGLGFHADGRPFYAMRFIRGETLADAITAFHADASLKSDPAARALALQKVLRRFLDVCNAVEFAHGRGVLHRDIKPMNVILGAHGETLLVDWGLAKVLGAPAEESDIGTEPGPSPLSGTSQTMAGTALGTLGYMSPEQARGDVTGLGPASDVYSLGATLVCLLTGKPPFTGDAHALLEAALRGDLPRLRELDPRIDRALEAVCLKAMAPGPAARYSSARALADEIERWLADAPVTAYRDPLPTRAARWARRHRAAAAGLGMLLATAVVGLSVGNLLLDRERARTEASYRQARAAVDDYFTKVSENTLLDVPGLQPLRLELLDAASHYYRDFLRDHGQDPAVRKEAAAASFRLGWINETLGRHEDAAEPAARAVTLYGDLARAHPGEKEYREELARSHGLVAMAAAGMHRPQEALDGHRRALALREALARERQDDPLAKDDVLRTHSNIADQLSGMGRPQEALAEFDKAVVLGRELLAMPLDRSAPANPIIGDKRAWNVVHYDIARVHRLRAGLLRQTSRLEEANEGLKECLALYQELLDADPDNRDARAELAGTHRDLVRVLQAQGRDAEALGSLRSALQLQKELLAANPAVPSYRNGLGSTQMELASVLSTLGNQAEALATSLAAIATLEPLVKDRPDDTDAKIGLAQALRNQGKILTAMKRPADALPPLVRGRALIEQALERDPDSVYFTSNLAALLASLGRAHAATGDRPEAREVFDHAAGLVGRLADRYPSQHYDVACYLALMIPVSAPGEREALATRAMEELRRTLVAAPDALLPMDKDPDLDAIRGREDFRKLSEGIRARSARRSQAH